MNVHEEEPRLPFLSKGLWLLFWLQMAGMVGLSTLFATGSLLYFLIRLLELGLELFTVLVLLRLSRETAVYRWAGIAFGVCAGHDLLVLLLSFGGVPAWASATGLLMALVDLFAVFFEMTGHAAVTEDVEPDLSAGWKKLRLWYLAVATVAQATNFLGGLMTELAATVAGCAAVVLVVILISRMVTLYKSAKAFGDLAKMQS